MEKMTLGSTQVFLKESDLLFPRKLVYLFSLLQVESVVYLGAHSGFWVYPLMKIRPTTEFILVEGNPIVADRYSPDFESCKNVTYMNRVVSTQSKATFYTPIRTTEPTTLLRRIDHKIFPNYHASWRSERASWETEGSLLSWRVPHPRLEKDVECISLSGILQKLEYASSRKMLLTDLEGFDFDLIRTSTQEITEFCLVCFEVQFDGRQNRDDYLAGIKCELSRLGFYFYADDIENSNWTSCNMIFVQNSCEIEFATLKGEFDYLKSQAMFKVDKLSIANRLALGRLKGVILRMLSLIGYDVFSSR